MVSRGMKDTTHVADRTDLGYSQYGRVVRARTWDTWWCYTAVA